MGGSRNDSHPGAAMKLNRNHYFFAGIVLLLLGFELRLVETFVLNQQASNVLAQQAGAPERTAFGLASMLPNSSPSQALRSITPPKAVGWALLALGGILVLHSVALQKPEEAKAK